MTQFKFTKYTNPTENIQVELVKRPAMNITTLDAVIDNVFEKVRENGDQAIIELTQRFDNAHIDKIRVSAQEILESHSRIDQTLKESIEVAYQNIRTFHELQQLSTVKIETTPGVTCWQESRAIEKVGLYIPGGTAPLFSTVLMLAIPAQIAGCQEVVLCTPPDQSGAIHPAILYTAHRCGITNIFKVGGSQAIAAMVLGTESIPAVYKIFGPGNQYVTAAKMKALDYGVAIDLPAGPSEVLVLADSSAVPSYIASDLLSQAEHGIDSQVVLVTTDADQISAIESQIEEQLKYLPRQEIARKSLLHAYCVAFDEMDEAFKFINSYAPEHFIISSDRAEEYIPKIQNAGSVFLGNLTPESAGDYASGTNHTLPTSAYARSYSGVSLDSFIKKITFQKINEAGLRNLGPSIITMATAEQLDAHANAVRVRLQRLNE